MLHFNNVLRFLTMVSPSILRRLPELNSSSESEAREVWLSEWLEENKVL